MCNIIVGTFNFPSKDAAARYFSKTETNPDIDLMLKENRIAIGRPALKKNQVLLFNSEDERYFIQG